MASSAVSEEMTWRRADLDLKHLTKHGTPFVFSGKITDWAASRWTPENIDKVFGEPKLLRWRIGPKDYDDGVLWEGQCCYEEATAAQFHEWQLGSTSSSNPLSKYNRDLYWCYMDYKHMPEIFPEDVLKMVDWSPFGFDGRDGRQSTFWIGSSAAHTPCHYDTYGCNLVAQIYGCKRWILFPPSDTRHLYPTRIPYEESSVFSEVNIRHPDFRKHPDIKRSHPYMVTLKPGEVLFVPRHWWHYVECLDTAISINSWIEMDEDDEIRLEEAITRMMVMTFMSKTGDLEGTANGGRWLNPTEEYTSQDVNRMYINEVLKVINPRGIQPTPPAKQTQGDCEPCQENKRATKQHDASSRGPCECRHEVARKRCRMGSPERDKSDDVVSENTSKVHHSGMDTSQKHLVQALEVESCPFQQYMNIIRHSECSAALKDEKRGKVKCRSSCRRRCDDAATGSPIDVTNQRSYGDGSRTDTSPSRTLEGQVGGEDTSPSRTYEGQDGAQDTGSEDSYRHNLQSSIDQPVSTSAEMDTNQTDSLDIATLVNCFTHPSVVRTIAELLKNKMCNT